MLQLLAAAPSWRYSIRSIASTDSPRYRSGRRLLGISKGGLPHRPSIKASGPDQLSQRMVVISGERGTTCEPSGTG